MEPGLRRIVVVGCTCAGKTTLSQALAQQLKIPHIELDALHWEADWQMVSLEQFRERVTQALQEDAWVCDGNYSKVRDIVWSRADTVVWLDYDLALILWRLLRRTVTRVFTREQLWNGNRETFRGAFLSRDSLFLWALKTHRLRRKLYPELFASAEYAHLQKIRLRTPAETRDWMVNHF